jgi:hypothetical protein
MRKTLAAAVATLVFSARSVLAQEWTLSPKLGGGYIDGRVGGGSGEKQSKDPDNIPNPQLLAMAAIGTAGNSIVIFPD